ncbi:MAG: V-type ATP synthase subunit E [Nanoarchaeota archaeon]|nr:V-type ATP synthase subunit E [Nanoarchaeota archaeon]MCA9496099.1 V-type ATP synthase subunit E [Nanoarchaeota archaeon]
MSLEIISRDILSKAQEEKAQFEFELKEEISILEKNFEESIRVFKNTTLSKFEIELNSNKKTILSSSRTNAKKILLEKKSNLISQSISKTLEKLENMEKKDRENFLSKIIKNVNKEKISYEKIFCNKLDLGYIKSILPSKIHVLAKENLFGLVFEINGGKSIIDLSYAQILQDIFEEKESEFQKTLFQ